MALIFIYFFITRDLLHIVDWVHSSNTTPKLLGSKEWATKFRLKHLHFNYKSIYRWGAKKLEKNVCCHMYVKFHYENPNFIIWSYISMLLKISKNCLYQDTNKQTSESDTYVQRWETECQCKSLQENYIGWDCLLRNVELKFIFYLFKYIFHYLYNTQKV